MNVEVDRLVFKEDIWRLLFREYTGMVSFNEIPKIRSRQTRTDRLKIFKGTQRQTYLQRNALGLDRAIYKNEKVSLFP
jgi:hypothetical protein